MLMRTDPFSDFDRLTQQLLGTEFARRRRIKIAARDDEPALSA